MYKHEPDGRDYFVYRELTKVGKSLNNRQWYTGSMQGSPHRNSFGSPQRPRTASPQPEKLRNRLMMQQVQVHNQQMRPMGPDRLQEIEENLHVSHTSCDSRLCLSCLQCAVPRVTDTLRLYPSRPLTWRTGGRIVSCEWHDVLNCSVFE
eukprot:658190-Rhodomonas_salina.2